MLRNGKISISTEVLPICDGTDKDIAETYENDPAYKEPEDDKTNVLRRDPREEKQ